MKRLDDMLAIVVCSLVLGALWYHFHVKPNDERRETIIKCMMEHGAWDYHVPYPTPSERAKETHDMCVALIGSNKK